MDSANTMDRRIEKKKWPTQKLLLYIGIPILVLVGLGTLMRSAGTNRYRVDKDRLTISTVSDGMFQEFTPINGNVMALKSVFVTAIEGGQVEILHREGGELVKKGDLILKLSNPGLEMNYMNLQTNLLEQADQLRNTRITMENTALMLKDQLNEVNYQILDLGQQFERSKALYKDSIMAEAEYLTVKNNYEYQVRRKKLLMNRITKDSVLRSQQMGQVETSLRLVGRNLGAIQDNLDNLTVRAPANGLLSSIPVEVGQTITQGENLGQVDILGGYKVRASIDEHFISRIVIGLKGYFPFAGKDHELVIRKIYPSVTNGSFEVDMEFLEGAPEGIKRGQNLQIRLALSDESKAVMVPLGGFYQSTGGNYIFVLDVNGETAVKREIKIGRKSHKYYEVLQGLQPGERVVTSSYDLYPKADQLVLN